MPVIGIESILCKDYRNFKPLLFRNSPVIVDASDFASYYNGKDILYNLWGGEYLALALEWNRILGDLHRCSIDPLFLFSAGTERRGLQLNYDLTGFGKNLICLRHLLNGKANHFLTTINPLLLSSTLVDLLDALNVSHLCSAFSCQRSCASLANRLQCPVLASSPEYLLLCGELPHVAYTGFSFIPLQCVNPDPVELCVDFMAKKNITSSEQPTAFALASHEFLPSNTGYYKVPSFYRPLLFLLLGTDSLPRIRLPKHLLVLMNQDKKGDYKTRRWNTVMFWLQQFKEGSVQPIDQLYRCYPLEEQEPMVRCLVNCVQAYMPDISIGRRLNSFLLQSPLPAQHSDPVHRGGVPATDKASVESNARMELLAVLKGAKPETGDFDFTSGWPENLVRTFHQSKMVNFVFSALYCSGGLVLPRVVENLNTSTSVWDASLALRLLHYRYLCGLELKLGQSEKLIGLMPNAVEYVRVGDKQVRRRISVEPSYVRPKEDTTDVLLASCLGFSFTDTLPMLDSVLSVVVTLCVWHRCNSINQTLIMPFDRTPLALATLLCSVANHFNFKKLDESLLTHYEGVSLFAESKFNFVQPPRQVAQVLLSASFKLDFVHQFNVIQGIYLCLRSAVALLDQLLPLGRRSKHLTFSPSWKVFPSGRLIHGLAACLTDLEPSTRRHACVRFWLPRLLRLPLISQEAASLLRSASNFFDSSIDTAINLLAQRSVGWEPVYVDEPVVNVDIDSFKIDNCGLTPDNRTPHVDSNSRFQSKPQSPQARHRHDTSDDPIDFDAKKEAHASHLGRNSVSATNDLPSSGRQERRMPYYKRNSGYADQLKQRLGINK